MDRYIDKKQRTAEFDSRVKAQNAVCNGILKLLYDKLSEKLPEAAVIDIHSEFCAKEDNERGLSPLHYQEEYYERLHGLIQN